MAATNFCNDHISQNSFLSRFKPDYFVTGRINQNNAVNTLYIELIDAKNLFLIASNHLPVDELHNTSQFIIDNILQTVHKPERSVRLAKQDQGYKNHYLSDEMLAGKKELYDFTPESIYRAMTIFDRLQNKSDIQTLKTECYCLLAECHMSLALHGKSELELAAQKALELLDYVSDITTVDGKILAIMGLITGLSGQAKVSHILFEQAKIHSTDIASLYYYRALVHFHNEKIEEARICIDKSLQLEPRRRKAVVIKECVHMDCEKISSRYSSDNQLTNRESEILQLIADGKTNKEIANFLQLSRKTVETHRLNIMKKLDVHSGIELIKTALRMGVCTL